MLRTALLIVVAIVSTITMMTISNITETSASVQLYPDSCRVNGLLSSDLPDFVLDFWDKEDRCLLDMTPMQDTTTTLFGGDGDHRHGSRYDLYGHSHDGGNHSHSLSSPFQQSLYMYDTFIAHNPLRQPWEVALSVPVRGLNPAVAVEEYNSTKGEWETVRVENWSDQNSPAKPPHQVTAKWTPVTGKTYKVTVTMQRTFTESPFDMLYLVTDNGTSQGTKIERLPLRRTERATWRKATHMSTRSTPSSVIRCPELIRRRTATVLWVK